MIIDCIKLFIHTLKIGRKVKKELRRAYYMSLFEPRTDIKLVILQTSVNIISKMLKEDEIKRYGIKPK